MKEAIKKIKSKYRESENMKIFIGGKTKRESRKDRNIGQKDKQKHDIRDYKAHNESKQKHTLRRYVPYIVCTLTLSNV